MPETINLTPNYPAMCKRFRDVAMGHLESFANPRKHAFTRKEVYDFVSTFRIALSSATSVGEIYNLRDSFDAAADKIFATVEKEQS